MRSENREIVGTRTIMDVWEWRSSCGIAFLGVPGCYMDIGFQWASSIQLQNVIVENISRPRTPTGRLLS